MSAPIIIAIDGYSSTGKSSFAKLIAREIGYIYIDTGAIYRAVTLQAARLGLISDTDDIDLKGLEKMLSGGDAPVITFRVSTPEGSSETYIGDENVEKEIRSMKISEKVSHIAAVPIVRSFVDRLLHRLGESRGVIMDGRDIGTAVFPDAELKIFMTASPEIRAQRRKLELEAKGEKTDFSEVLKNIRERDLIDTTRKTDPLVKAPDAILLDNSHMTIEDQLIWVKDLLKKKFGSI